ncbi:PP2C family protein-serine/threonine phosphatase [Desulfosediminicola ganghwensis]|uniref:PP2C family protein-serine/threonine phosphatase n=1 Tax=Desulfosediminicola ganghwensis TaxID=2569540 RepID=UPI0010AC3913|nr:PP2C family protein-serine/threonine phosphatase [Desulfosediminicola ganghwensis]
MTSDKECSTLESINRSLREEIAELTHRLKSKEQEVENLGALSLTEIILENSNAILFRRLAADDPKKRKMVYVSPNISCFGYHAEDFLVGKIMFRDIVYHEDSARTLKEIQDFVKQGIESYSQTYRIITGNGDIRWIEDRTSIFEDPSTGTRYHQGIVIDIHEKKKALQLAAEVQKSLLPEDDPIIDGLDIAGKTFPCDEVGGDYFDYLPESTTGNGSLSIIIGDISGHGVDAALLMASARAFLRMRASQQGAVKDIVMAMNRHLTEDMEKNGRFMTLFYLTLDRCHTSMEWVRAGHDPAVLYDPVTDLFTELKGPGLALGIDKDYDYHQQQFESLAPHQVLLLTTDGIYEACNQDNEMFGKERMQNIVRQHSTQTAKNILDQIIQEHNSFTSGVAQADDITIVIVKII